MKRIELTRGLVCPSRRLSLDPLGSAVARGDEEVAPKTFTNLTKSAITRLFKQHAATNPELMDRLDEYLTLAAVLPFRTNNYVVEELIDWNNVPADPIFQLTFPQPGMLPAEWLEDVHKVRMSGGSAKEVRKAADVVRERMNPHPAKQREMNGACWTCPCGTQACPRLAHQSSSECRARSSEPQEPVRWRDGV